MCKYPSLFCDYFTDRKYIHVSFLCQHALKINGKYMDQKISKSRIRIIKKYIDSFCLKKCKKHNSAWSVPVEYSSSLIKKFYTGQTRFTDRFQMHISAQEFIKRELSCYKQENPLSPNFKSNNDEFEIPIISQEINNNSSIEEVICPSFDLQIYEHIENPINVSPVIDPLMIQTIHK
jgi:hypothetical protein